MDLRKISKDCVRTTECGSTRAQLKDLHVERRTWGNEYLYSLRREKRMAPALVVRAGNLED